MDGTLNATSVQGQVSLSLSSSLIAHALDILTSYDWNHGATVPSSTGRLDSKCHSIPYACYLLEKATITASHLPLYF